MPHVKELSTTTTNRSKVGATSSTGHATCHPMRQAWGRYTHIHSYDGMAEAGTSPITASATATLRSRLPYPCCPVRLR